MSDDLRHRLDVAAQAVWEAGKITLRYFQTALTVELKGDHTPVTAADREAERVLKESLLGAFPRDGFLGEESGERPGESGYVWVVDPVDGTKSFVQGVPLFGVMVGLEDPSGVPVLGVVGIPALDELVTAARGEGCFWNGRKARVTSTTRLADACVVYTSGESHPTPAVERACREIHKRARLSRGWGDCYGHLLVATGRADVMLDPILADWDCVALLPILEEAGGTFTDWGGRRTARGKSGISTNGRLLREVQEIIQATGSVPGS
jgi:histidinol-phosphatase